MKQIKIRMIIETVLLVLSIIGIILSTIYDNSFAIGFSSSILGFSAVSLIRLSKISKSEEEIKEYQILEKDERLILINREARSISFSILTMAMLVLGIIGYIIDNETMLFMSTGSVFIGIISYLITYAILNKTK